MTVLSIPQAATHLQAGHIIAYPTEAVFGLGCAPENNDALWQLIKLKERDPNKGLILIASDIAQLLDFLDLSQISKERWQQIQASWPGPYTWVIPAAATVSPLVTGAFNSIAVRVTAHPIASALCQAFNGAIISTSANKAGVAPCREAREVQACFGDQIAGVVAGEVNKLTTPTRIEDALTGALYR